MENLHNEPIKENQKKNQLSVLSADNEKEPKIICTVFDGEGNYYKAEVSSNKLTKSSFGIIIDWLNKQKEKHANAFE